MKQDSAIQFEQIADYIEIHIHLTSLNGEQLGQHFGLSRMQIHRIIKEHSGLNTGELIKKIRIRKSIYYLINTELSIEEIAYLVGFKDPSYFTKVFKSIHKSLPSQYRKEH